MNVSVLRRLEAKFDLPHPDFDGFTSRSSARGWAVRCFRIEHPSSAIDFVEGRPFAR